MKDVELANTGSLAPLLSPEFHSAQIVDRGVGIALVVSADRMAAIDATLAVLATNGAMAAIAEGLADLDAGRADAWPALRANYGRTEGEIATGPRVSHRACWDLELLPPDVAQHCFDALDAVTDPALGMAMVAAFPQLRIVAAHGYRMLIRPANTGSEIVHIDTGTIEVTT